VPGVGIILEVLIRELNIIIYNYSLPHNEVPRCLRSPRPLRQNQYQYPNLHSAAKDLKALLDSVQSHASDEELNRVVEALKGKTLHQLISEGTKRVGASGPVAPAAGKAKEEKK